MSEYDEDDYEPAKGWLRIDVALKREVSVDGKTVHTATVDSREVEREHLDNIVRAEVEHLVTNLLKDEIQEQLAPLVAGVVEKVATPQIEKMLNEGWGAFNRYGAVSEKLTLTAVVAKAFEEGSNDYYTNKKAPSLPQRVVEAKVTELLDHKFKEELTKATAGFRARVDELLNAKIAEALRLSLGLR